MPPRRAGWRAARPRVSRRTSASADAGGVASLEESERADDANRTSGGGNEHEEPASDAFVASAEIQQGMDPDVLTDEQGKQ